VIENVRSGPVQPLAAAVTVINPTEATDPVLAPTKDGITEVVPDAARPMEVVLLCQANVDPAMLLAKVTRVVDAVLQTVWLATAVTVGLG
jgi:hypothetical protein